VLLSSRCPVNAEEIFRRFFWPLYPDDARADLERSRTVDANAGQNPRLLEHIEDAARRFEANAMSLFGADLGLDRSDASVHRLGAALTRERRDAWANTGAPGTAENALFNVVVHGAGYVGACVVAAHAGVWGVRRPLWESVVRLRSRAGEGDLPVFHWWLKSLADGAIDAGASLADRYRAHVEIPCARPEELPIVIADPRPLPRLKSPTYDLFHKYLRAHLPELRDLGRDFPSAERFADFAFRWVDFHVVGGGRNVVVAGASPHGLHLFWIGAHGFEKSSFVAGDAVPEPVVRVSGDRITAMTSRQGEMQISEMLWWGP
jgi:hypothetical protein